MRIGIIGAGKIGATAARLFAAAGHEVIVSASRAPELLRDVAAELGPGVRAGTVAEAARSGEIVLLAVPWRVSSALPAPELVRGKIVIDAMNPYRDDRGLYDLGDSTSSEETLKRLPGARLVKAFNTIFFKHLAADGRPELAVEDRRAIFVAGDDADAKSVVARLIEDIGFAAVDTGSLREGGKRQQPGTALYNHPMTARDARAALNGAG
jgi:8-hydroxy-5-deazaflavin:NADPH oxidoreductase